jgi:hypothetical protein
MSIGGDHAEEVDQAGNDRCPDSIEDLPVVFGTVQLEGVAGWLGAHWALKVGETWHEVGPDPDSTTGRIVARSARAGLSSNIVGKYDIRTSQGDRAASGARPTNPSTFSLASLLWSGLMLAVLGAMVAAALGGRPGRVLGPGLLGPVLLVTILPGMLAASGWGLVLAVGRRLGLRGRGEARCGALAALLCYVGGWVLAVWLVATILGPAPAEDPVTGAVMAAVVAMWGAGILWTIGRPDLLAAWRGENR